jgi:Ser/Thr protein kinase RdoA (MazF antagonist)
MNAPKKSASKKRLRWEYVPMQVQADIERLAGGRVLATENCAGGFSPGLASRLDLADGRRVFVKAMDAAEWPDQVDFYRAEARVAASLPPAVPAPQLLASSDDGQWVVLVFEWVDGEEPDLRRHQQDAFLVAAALDDLATTLTPPPIALPADHPRLGGWAYLAADGNLLARLTATSRWAADHLGMLIELQHFDAYPHNILMTPGRVWFVDWPHARPGAPVIDLIAFASSAAAAGIDPEQLLAESPVAAAAGPRAVDAILAAHAGFCVAGSLYEGPPELAPVIAAKAELGTAAVAWLRRRLARRKT